MAISWGNTSSSFYYNTMAFCSWPSIGTGNSFIFQIFSQYLANTRIFNSICNHGFQVIIADQKLISTIKFCLSKFKNRKSKTGLNPPSLPSVVPNWASLKKRARPLAFEDPLYGLRALCYKLKLDINVWIFNFLLCVWILSQSVVR